MITASDQPKPDITEDDAPAVAGTLQELLAEISTSVDLADRRYADVVGQMQQKLAALDTLAKTKREKAQEAARRQAEEEAARAAEAAKRQAEAEAAKKAEADAAEAVRRQAEADAQAEADRLAKAVEAAKAAAAQAIEKAKARDCPADVDPFDIIDHGPAETRRPREPWDTESADVFARHFEQFESLLPPMPQPTARQLERFHPSQPPPQPLLVTADPPAERAWLEGRFNDIASRISEMMAANATGELGARFSSLEVRIDAAMETVTTQATSGSDTLKQIETHIAEIDEHVDYIRSELARLDGVEAQIRALMERQKADEAANQRAIAASAATATAQSEEAAGHAQLAGLLNRLMAERRHTEEHTVAMLDTLQQAMIRVLDRVEAIESAQGGESSDHDQHTQQRQQAKHLEHLSVDPHHEAPQAPHDAPDMSHMHAQPSHAPVAQDSYFMDFEVDEAAAEFNRAAQLDTTQHSEDDAELQSTITQIRRNFIADAERARPKQGSGADHAAAPQSRARQRRTLIDRIMHPTSKQLAVAALGLMVPLNSMFLYLVMKPGTAADQPSVSASAAAEEAPAPLSEKLTEASQALASEPPISTSETEFPTDSMSRIGRPAASAENIALKEPAAAPAAAEGTRVELPPATVGPLTLRRAAADGDASAQFEVAARLAEGKGIDQNFKGAIEWYLRSASHGFAQAQYRIGTHYERGLGVEKDPERARVWYQRAAEQGTVKAMHNLAVLATKRPDGKPDYAEALRWFTDAAQYNLPDSQYNLAILHESGLGVPQDPKAAYFWFSLAARNGDKEAIKRKESVKALLSADALAAAETEIRGFRGKPQIPLANDARVAGELWKKRQVGEN